MGEHDSFLAAVADSLSDEVTHAARLGGGDVAESFRLDLASGSTVFAKTHRDPPPQFFTTEALGLQWLRDADAVAVPQVLAVSDEPAFLVIEWIDEGRADGSTEADLGRAMAALHRAGAPSFGREDRRTTGSRRLPNDPCGTWVEFYAARRLEPLARLAADNGALPGSTIGLLDEVVSRLGELGGPAESPARLHGDLWAGNRLVDASGRSWLIDPAAHGGHREYDLAMMRLFGGFGDACFAAYDAAFPLADRWRDRVPLHQLAPLTVHAIKFGGVYVDGTRVALERVLRNG